MGKNLRKRMQYQRERKIQKERDMKIAICEDEKIIAEKIWNFFFDMKDINAKCYPDAESLLSEYENGERYDLIFCDVVMNAMNGIDLCRAVKKLDENVYFCMITNYVDYAPSGYEAGVFRYLLKPVEKKDVLRVLEDMQNISSSSQKIVIRSFHESVIIKSESLIYIEVKDKYSYVHYWTQDDPRREKTILTANSLHHLEEMLISYVLVYLSNVMASLIILFYYLLFFVKGFTNRGRRFLSIIFVFLVIHALVSLTDVDYLVTITVLGILPVVDLFCCRNRIYNLFMIIPAILFYVLTAVFPMFMVPLITRDSFIELHGVGSLTLPGFLSDLCITGLLIGTYVLCRRRKIDLRLHVLEVAGFLGIFLFSLFMLLSIGVYNDTLDFEISVVFDILAAFFMLTVFLSYWSYLIIARDRTNMKRAASQAQNYLAMQLESLALEETNRQEIKIMKHDLRNHLQVIQEMCNAKQYVQLESYIRELSGNPILSKSFCITVSDFPACIR